MILDEIIEFKRGEVRPMAASANSRLRRVAEARAPRDFAAALMGRSVSVIAEIKPKSPSRGVFAHASDAVALALRYQDGGASALSVLADREFFGGGPELVQLIANDPRLVLPVLYKEFVVDPQQVYEARACGADAVLLIVRAVTRRRLRDLVGLTNDLGMAALVETFNEDEVAAALAAGARIIGVNNRDLQTFEVDLGRSARLSPLIPDGVIKVSESGIRSRADVVRVGRAGFHAVLVGTMLLSSPDPGARLASLLGRATARRTRGDAHGKE
jgi:indole-3-glycerol phosphate synthase